MDQNESNSLAELNKFIEAFRLRDDNGNIIFPAHIHFKVNGRNSSLQTDVHISSGSYHYSGTIFISDREEGAELDINLYPGMFHANYQQYTFVDGKALLVKGYDETNKSIGEYTVEIMPIKST